MEISEGQYQEWQDDPIEDICMYWTTKEGRRIYIPDLPNGHLVNIIKMLRRKAPAFRFLSELQMVTGPQPSGEMAMDAFNAEMDDMSRRTDEEFLLDEHPQYANLLTEARDRKLNLEEPTR